MKQSSEGKPLFWLLLIPPAAAVVMGALMLGLAIETNPGVIQPSAPPLSKTSWREAAAASESPAADQPVDYGSALERERPKP